MNDPNNGVLSDGLLQELSEPLSEMSKLITNNGDNPDFNNVEKLAGRVAKTIQKYYPNFDTDKKPSDMTKTEFDALKRILDFFDADE